MPSTLKLAEVLKKSSEFWDDYWEVICGQEVMRGLNVKRADADVLYERFQSRENCNRPPSDVPT